MSKNDTVDRTRGPELELSTSIGKDDSALVIGLIVQADWAGYLGLVPYVGVHCALQLPRPAHLPVALGAAATPLPMLLTPWPDAAWFALLTLPVTSGMLAVRQMIHRGTELQEVETAWAVSAGQEGGAVAGQ